MSGDWGWKWWCPVCKKHIVGSDIVQLNTNIEDHIYFHEFLARIRFVNESWHDSPRPVKN